MIRSLFGGVSGLRNHQTLMDVIGNNIANVNTVGFKKGRVTFKESLALMMQGAQSATENIGGKNPVQIGLGMEVGSIDSVFSQGNLENTGQTTDMAIQGDSFFVVSDGNRQYFTRAGNFQLDANGRLVNPNNGFVLQGKMADSQGSISEGTAVDDIVLPFGTKIPAKATSEVSLSGNLDAAGPAKGTILDSDGIYAVEGGASDINGLLRVDASNGDYSQIQGMAPNSTTVTLRIDDGDPKVYTYVENDIGTNDDFFHTIDDLMAEIENDLSANYTIAMNSSGQIDITEAGGSGETINFSSSNSDLDRALSALNGTYSDSSQQSDEFSHVATSGDNLIDLRNLQGVSLGLSTGDDITINGKVGGESITTASKTVGTDVTTYGEYANAVEIALGINNADGVAIDEDDGSVTINGDGGTVNAISDVDISADSGGSAVTAFNAIFDDTTGNYFARQDAQDYTQNASITIYDSKGDSHILTFEFTKNPVEVNKWSWEASVGTEGASILSGSSGVITFDSDGNLDTFTYDGGFQSLKMAPGNGAGIMDLDVDPGTFDTIDGLSQFAGSANAIVDSQDGYTSGDLSDMTIDDAGKVTGFFNNGVTRDLAQIVLASFNNPNGLVRSGDNMYEVSGNSGQPVVGKPGETIQSSISSGSLEQSNVELAEEFTKMIVAQRGFQANARVLTVSDQLLQEVVGLKR
ncbi:MAG: flagellar hook-basal body complex protein [Candidatus Marinimicrobia bacterium]|nr:flagellar hook-basal body complex protein [Candidatus Neomarinimicrobiota bacterium]MCF7880506.1 flagellar hook-basal body complex protein [Candidatus Neomarinimicrobiota bacterium]